MKLKLQGQLKQDCKMQNGKWDTSLHPQVKNSLKVILATTTKEKSSQPLN